MLIKKGNRRGRCNPREKKIKAKEEKEERKKKKNKVAQDMS